MNRLALNTAARRVGLSVRTLRTYVAEGMTVSREGRRMYVRLEHALAWKRWKALQNPAAQHRRARAAAQGERGAVVSPVQMRRARAEWIAAGGRAEP